MSKDAEREDVQFYQLVISLQASAMHQMGKVVSPLTGKIERDLDMARNSIDLLEMLQRKTKGNLDEDEKKLLGHALYELRLNYVDELKKKAVSESEGGQKATSDESDGQQARTDSVPGSDHAAD